LRRRIVYLGAVVAIAPWLASCARTFVIRPVGIFGEAITFYFYEAAGADNPSDEIIAEFAVQEQIANAKWMTNWEVTGRQSMSSIVYGRSYQGLSERTPAKLLTKTAQYRVIASSQPRLGPIGYSAAYFTFSESGSVVLTQP
jgi:hypothetical protein